MSAMPTAEDLVRCWEQTQGGTLPTLRDHFAIAALSGLLSTVRDPDPTENAKCAYELADAMLAQRETHPDFEARCPVSLDDAIRTARLWRVGKMIGGDEDAVRDALLAEVERLQREKKDAEDTTGRG